MIATFTPGGTVTSIEGRWTTVDVIALSIVALAAVIVHGWIAAFDYTSTSFTDSVDYLYIADFYRSVITGESGGYGTDLYRNTRFPPLFPLLIALGGGGTEHQHGASIVSNAVAIAAALAVWIWVRRDSGSPLTASLVALATLGFPYYFAFNLTPVSEPLGILISACVFALFLRRPMNRSRLFVLALLAGIAPLSRTALLPLNIAFALMLFADRSLTRREAALPLVVSLLPFAAWVAYRNLAGADSYGKYLGAQLYADEGITWPSALWVQPIRLFDAFVAGWGLNTHPPYFVPFCAFLLMLAFVGTLLRMRWLRLDAWFLAGYVALVLIWPFPNEYARLLLAAFPCILLAASSASASLDARLGRRLGIGSPAQLVLCAVVAALFVPAAYKFAHRAALPVANELLGEKREPGFFLADTDDDALKGAESAARARLLLIQARDVVPEDDCIYALPPQIARLYSRRNVLAYPLGLGNDPEKVRAKMMECNYYFVGVWHARRYGVDVLYPYRGLRGWTEPVLVTRMKKGEGTTDVAALLRRIPVAERSPEADSPAIPELD